LGGRNLVWPEVVFVVLALVASAITFGAVLPRLAESPITLEGSEHPTSPTLSGARFLAWVAINAGINFALLLGYSALRTYRGDARLYFMCLVAAILASVFQSPASRARTRNPDARFGAFLGVGIAVGAALFVIARAQP
jgi:hypothetical protein